MLEIVAQQRNITGRARAPEFFEPLSYDCEHGYYYLCDGSVGFGFSCDPVNNPDKTIVADLEELVRQAYPSNTILQAIIWSWPDRDSDGMTRTAKSLFIIKFPCARSLPGIEEREKIIELRKKLYAVLRNIGAHPEIIEPQVYLDVLRKLIGEDKKDVYDDTSLIREQIASNDRIVELGTSSMQFGSKRVSVLSVRRYPEYVSQETIGSCYFGGKLKGDPFPPEDFMLALNIFYPDQDRIVHGGENDSYDSKSTGTMDDYSPPLNAKNDVLYHRLDGDKTAILCNMTFCLFDKVENEKKEVYGVVSKAINYYRKIGMQVQEDQFIALPLFLNALPFGADAMLVDDLMRYRPMSVKDVSNLIPVGYKRI